MNFFKHHHPLFKEIRKPSQIMEVADNFNKEEIQMQTTQCTKVGDNGEIITVSITTEESHQTSMLGKSLQLKNTLFTQHT